MFYNKNFIFILKAICAVRQHLALFFFFSPQRRAGHGYILYQEQAIIPERSERNGFTLATASSIQRVQTLLLCVILVPSILLPRSQTTALETSLPLRFKEKGGFTAFGHSCVIFFVGLLGSKTHETCSYGTSCTLYRGLPACIMSLSSW